MQQSLCVPGRVSPSKLFEKSRPADKARNQASLLAGESWEPDRVGPLCLAAVAENYDELAAAVTVTASKSLNSPHNCQEIETLGSCS
ncbi:unnamed protein product [Protopolystoma xenopodis]|uniref:Uncharacterized protein n=1 Tax=Protopolystoma xenopodis TaxID=117903 RepID=A0A3S4ZAX7_9PLAT|nr:unnamed protein product [Protopolystoma xenopodis]